MMELEAPCLFLARLQDQQAIQKEHQELKNRKNKKEKEWTDAQPLAPPSPSESVSWHRSKSNMMVLTVKRLWSTGMPFPGCLHLASFAATQVHTAPAKETPWAKVPGLQSPRLWPGKRLPLLLLRRMWLISRANLIAQPRCSWEDDECESEDEGNSQEPEENNDEIPCMDDAVANKNQPKPAKLHLSA